MAELVVTIAGAAGRLAGQLLGPRLAAAAFGPAEERVLRKVLEEALKASLAAQLRGAGEQAAIMVMHLETLLGRFFADPAVAKALVDSALARTEPPLPELLASFDAQGMDSATVGIDLPALLSAMSAAVAEQIRVEAGKAGSPLFNLLVVNHLERQDGRASTPRIVGMAPPPPQSFVGRGGDLEQLRERLTGGDRQRLQVVTAVRGWPGVGKTTTAAALVHDAALASAFPGGVLWARIGQTDRVRTELIAWLRSLDEEPDPDLDVPHLSSRLSALLRDRAMLLVVDDVWDPAHAAPFLVGGADCATIITTRAKSVAEAVASSHDQVYRLEVLDEESSIRLLAQLAPQVASAHEQGLRDLARAVEGLPLALQVAGRMLAAEAGRGLPVDELLAEVTQGFRLFSASVPAHLAGLAEESSATVAAVLDRSVSSLDPADRLRFICLGAFAPKPATFSIAEILGVWGAMSLTADLDGLRVLVDRGLLEPAGNGDYQMHALMALFADSLSQALDEPS
ncbi:hypothetical protein JOF56_006988 [Kibdelosporangium banguiense]|uniref:NB-ARC domain-containing protein n=1 Tax=Kibdelosporangium banguiense TaxID=1365924 RepID=A0ABS4TRR6_9PSEU|nr:NB-ARC domain-containing protein [Kibdelosporangium banguiense]MBP2326603.1 hypothetical protein [Kibdelosporangium banguiense]